MKKTFQHSDIDRGRAWVSMVAIYVIIINLSAQVYMSGVLYVALLDKFKEGKAKTALVGSICVGVQCISSPLATMVINRYNSRVVIFIGTITSSFGLFLSAFMTSLNLVIVTAGFITGIGFGFTITGALVHVIYCFKKYRNQIIAGYFVLPGCGMLYATPFSVYVISQLGLNSYFLVNAAIMAQLSVCGALSKPSSQELEQIQKRQQKGAADISSTAGVFSCFNFSLLQNVPLVLYLFNVLMWKFAWNVALVHLPNYIKSSGLKTSDIESIMAAFSIANTIGRALTLAYITKKTWNCLFLNIAVLGISGSLTACFPLYSHSVIGGYMFAIQLGVFLGVTCVLMVPLSTSFVSEALLPEANSLSFWFSGVGVTIGPIIAGFIYDLAQTYSYSFVISGLMLVLGSMLSIGAHICGPADDKQTNDTTKMHLNGDATMELIVEEQTNTTTKVHLNGDANMELIVREN